MQKISDFKLASWVEITANSDFPIYNLPLGIIKHKNGKTAAATAIGDHVLDLSALHLSGYFKDISLPSIIFQKEYLNDFIALGKPLWNSLRQRIKQLLSNENGELRDNG